MGSALARSGRGSDRVGSVSTLVSGAGVDESGVEELGDEEPGETVTRVRGEVDAWASRATLFVPDEPSRQIAPRLPTVFTATRTTTAFVSRDRE
jgi:hypothetical protein